MHTREYSAARGSTVYIYYFRSSYEAKPVPPPAQNSGDATEYFSFKYKYFTFKYKYQYKYMKIST